MLSLMSNHFISPRRTRSVVGVVAALAIASPAGAVCIDLGVYQDDPVNALPTLTKRVGTGISTLSVYVTTGRSVDPRITKLAKQRGMKLLVTWAPDGGRDGVNQPTFTNAAVASGKFDAQLAALTTSLAALKLPVIIRPMPEPNQPWFAWSGNVNGNTPASYVAAFRRASKVIRRAGKGRAKVMWAPYVRSTPDEPENQLAAYYPGPNWVDAVGVSGPNFGTTGGHIWKDPSRLFGTAYAQVEALGRKPFWITETGSVAAGGNKAKWIALLGDMKRKGFRNLVGAVWYDQRDPLGDFRIGPAKAELVAFRKLVKTSGCRPKAAKVAQTRRQASVPATETKGA